MIKKSVITTLLIIASFVALAQDKPVTNAKADSVIKRMPTEIISHTAYDYSINGKMQTSEEVKARLYAYAPSKVELLRSSRETSWLGVSIIGFGLSGIAATLEFIDKSGSVTHYNSNGAYVLSGVATALVFSAIFHSIRAKRHSNKALALYNQQYQ
jgi:hypothetical protein